MKKFLSVIIAGALALSLTACNNETKSDPQNGVQNSSLQSISNSASADNLTNENKHENGGDSMPLNENIPENFVLINGGTFNMGSPENEPWRSADETLHSVTVSDFYICKFELTQREYSEITGENPSNFSGDNLPVENISWLDSACFKRGSGQRKHLGKRF